MRGAKLGKGKERVEGRGREGRERATESVYCVYVSACGMF